ncbi:unnamed protein product [Tenebrio molitor]|nr:unnamed protein product [Tenebrio molitor]
MSNINRIFLFCSSKKNDSKLLTCFQFLDNQEATKYSPKVTLVLRFYLVQLF